MLCDVAPVFLCNRTMVKHKKKFRSLVTPLWDFFSNSMKENKNVLLYNGVTFNINIYLNEAVSSLSEK